tara:strand:- start:59 stop:205 length:147 start_codon:yes stop_codon:yes gene_type:complete
MRAKLYKWLFSAEERAPIGFIPMLLVIIVVSLGVNLLLIPIVNTLFKL